jgi:ring-1,2-phenylacetyl-CoA epoxidase subunit PaaB
MPDTQWPRYMVFQQHREEQAYVHNGTVHASDAEMALLNARDVFSRRPEATGMWVVPADQILSMTHQELEKQDWKGVKAKGKTSAYHVFGKFYEQGQCEQIGEVEATSHEHAMQLAIQHFEKKNPIWWWVFPASTVIASLPDEAGSMFVPALSKTYKNQSEYPTVTMMRQLHQKGRLDGQS